MPRSTQRNVYAWALSVSAGTFADADKMRQLDGLAHSLAKLAGGVAQIKVGGATETAMKERKALYEDAMQAMKAALEEGIVTGGGTGIGNGFGNGTAGSGIGLRNVRERLQLAYGADATFDIAANFPAGVAATITVPLAGPKEARHD